MQSFQAAKQLWRRVIGRPIVRWHYKTKYLKIGKSSKGRTTIQAYKSVRKLKNQVSCTVHNGVYHPWGNTKNSIINYYTLYALTEYQALESTPLAQDDGSADVVIEQETLISPVYYAEGSCGADYKGKVIGFECQSVTDAKENFKNISPDSNFYEEWFYVKCAEGYNAFVQADENLLKQKGVYEAELVEYGKVR